jgi:hypothetical protein
MDPADRARRLADGVLFPRALETEAAGLVPVDLLDRLASEGFYGMAAPADVGGWDLSSAEVQPVVEALAGGCLTTTFVWIQHHNPVRAVAASATPGLRETWLGPLARGETRAGIALAGERPGPPMLWATETPDGGFSLEGEAPWITGWNRIDVVMVAARWGDDVVRVLVDAVPGETVRAEPLRLVATDASGTVTVRFRGHPVPPERVVGVEAHADAIARDPTGLRTNGSLALGVAARCLELLGPGDAERPRRRRTRGPPGRSSTGGRAHLEGRRSVDRGDRRPLDRARPGRPTARARGDVPARVRIAAPDQTGARRPSRGSVAAVGDLFALHPGELQERPPHLLVVRVSGEPQAHPGHRRRDLVQRGGMGHELQQSGAIHAPLVPRAVRPAGHRDGLATAPSHDRNVAAWAERP